MPETMVWDRLEHDADRLEDADLQALNEEGNGAHTWTPLHALPSLLAVLALPACSLAS